MSALFEALVGAEARECSLLYTLAYIATATDGSTPGTVERLIDTRGGAQAERFVEGAQMISIRLAHHIGHQHIVLKLAGPQDRARQEPRHGGVRQDHGAGPQRDRGDPADAGPADLLRADPAGEARRRDCSAARRAP